jgi:hypothetical protein
MASQVTLKALGLNYSPNNLALPEGSMIVADDVIIRRDNVVESRRGIKEYSENFGTIDSRSKQILSYRDRILNHYSNILQYETGEFNADGKAILANFSSTLQETEDGLRIKSTESNKNLYITSSEGIKKISAKTASDLNANSLGNAGAVKAIDFSAKLNITQGQQTGFLGFDTAVAYRIIWGYKDNNDNLILGAPSDAISVYNFLSSVCALDINELCLRLDKLKQDSATYYSVIHNTNSNIDSSQFNDSFSEAFSVGVESSAVQMQASVIGIATNIDKFSVLADMNAVANDKPLKIYDAAVANSGIEFDSSTDIVTINFAYGDPSLVFSSGDKIEILGITNASFSFLNNTATKQYYEILSVIPPTGGALGKITFTFTSAGASLPVANPGASTVIYSYNYRYIINTVQFDITSADYTKFGDNQELVNLEIPPEGVTDAVWANIESNVYAIMSRLKLELSGYISTALQNQYIQELFTTNAGNVDLVVNVPTEIQNNSNYFLQVYRTENFAAGPENILGVDVVPDDEMNLVYEQLITPPQVTIEFTDVYSDTLRGFSTPLYTNPTTGEGIQNANEPPPIAKDINRFKNVVFYANTKTRHILPKLTLLGVNNINDGDTFTISDIAGNSSEYVFVLGIQETNAFTFDPLLTPANLVTAGVGKYFEINSANDETSYYFWYRVNNVGTSPVVPNKTGVIIDILSTDSFAEILSKTLYTIKSYTYDFNVSLYSKYTFTCSSSPTASIGDVYEINGSEYMVIAAPSGATFYAIGNIDPPATGTLNLVDGSGSASIAYTSYTSTDNVILITNVKEGFCTDATNGNIGAQLVVTKIVDGQGEDAAQNKVLLSQLISTSQSIDATARSLVRVINRNVSSVVNAYYGSGPNTLPGIINFESKTLIDNPFYIVTNNASSGQSFTPDLGPMNYPPSTGSYITNIVQTTPNTVTVTTNGAHSLQTSDRIIICNTNAPISAYENLNGVFTVTVDQTIPNRFVIDAVISGPGTTGSWSRLADVNVSTNEEKPNRIYYSKPLQPEAVPLLNALDVGSANKKILRIFPLRDSLFVFKEDGLFRISGETAPFVVSLFDSSCILIAPDSVSVANNIIYAWTNKGISNVTEAGVSEISRPIDTIVLKLASSNFANFPKITWGVGYDSDNSYTVYTNKSVDDEYATIGFRYSNLTNTWTNINRSQTCGLISNKDDKMYLGSGDVNLINQERKDFSRLDYADKDFPVTVANGNIQKNGSYIKLLDIDGIKVGDVIVQEQLLNVYDYNALLMKLDFDPNLVGGYEQALTTQTGADLRQDIEDLATALDADPNIASPTYSSTIANKSGAISSIVGYLTSKAKINSPNHGLETGRIVTIAGTTTTNNINGVHKITKIDSNNFYIDVKITIPQLTAGGTFNTLPTIEGKEDVAACFNIMIDKLNQSGSGTAFKNYKKITETKLFEAVITEANKFINALTLNLGLQFVVGEMQIYQAIPCSIRYAPITFNDPLTFKQVYEATIMFNNKAFTKATALFSSDLKPEYSSVEFYGQGNGIFGHYSEPGFGFGFFGGLSNSAPFRTIVPRDAQRCRFSNIGFEHATARENWALFGITLTFNQSGSTRAYR